MSSCSGVVGLNQVTALLFEAPDCSARAAFYTAKAERKLSSYAPCIYRRTRTNTAHTLKADSPNKPYRPTLSDRTDFGSPFFVFFP